MLTLAIGTLTVVYVIFGTVCYSAYGAGTDTIITEMMPPTVFTAVIKILFCVNLIFSYSIMIHPTNMIIEGWMFSEIKNTQKRKWAKNISRALICIIAVTSAILLEGNLEQFLGILGALLCAPLALTIPTCLHLKILATTRYEKIVDWSLLVLSIGVLVLGTSQSIRNWK